MSGLPRMVVHQQSLVPLVFIGIHIVWHVLQHSVPLTLLAIFAVPRG